MSASDREPPMWPTRAAWTVRTTSTRILRAMPSRRAISAESAAPTAPPTAPVDVIVISTALALLVRAGDDGRREHAQQLHPVRTIAFGGMERAGRDVDGHPRLQLGGVLRAHEPPPSRDAVDGLLLGVVDMAGRLGARLVDGHAD